MPKLPDILVMDREKLRTFTEPSDFRIDSMSMGEDQRITIYTEPRPDHRYVAGADFSYGIEGRDYDALIIADRNTDPIEQVAELEGRWGSDCWDRLIYAILVYYQHAFLVGERQVGLPVLRSLLTTFRYNRLYYNRDEASRGRRRQDTLGHHKIAGDPTVTEFRKAIREHQFLIRSPRTIRQLGQYQFRPKGRSQEKTLDLRDADLTMGAPNGEFDDLVNAGMYCWKGIQEVPKFEDEKKFCEEGKAGDVLGMAKALAQPKAAHSAFRGYRQ